MGEVFGPEDNKLLKVAKGYLRTNGTNFAADTISNIELAQRQLSLDLRLNQIIFVFWIVKTQNM